MKAHCVETFPWNRHARQRGVTVEGLEGMFVISLNDYEASLDRAIEEWKQHTRAVYHNSRHVLNDNGEIRFEGDFSHCTYTRELELDVDELKRAIRLAVPLPLYGHKKQFRQATGYTGPDYERFK